MTTQGCPSCFCNPSYTTLHVLQLLRQVEGEALAHASEKTVLVVDDEEDIRYLIALILESEGYRVETAMDGRAALTAIERRMPDLIVLDMKMPIMNGWEFAREFRARHNGQVPILVLTAADDARKRAEEIGAAGWLGKPFELDALVRAIGRYVR
ncbi:MAG: response regulator [Chloroflexi bacterium]|nr:response regulator [Chloroflexota bacterium]